MKDKLTNQQIDTLKKELDLIEVEERLEMVQLSAVSLGCCCFCNDTCSGGGED